LEKCFTKNLSKSPRQLSFCKFTECHIRSADFWKLLPLTMNLRKLSTDWISANYEKITSAVRIFESNSEDDKIASAVKFLRIHKISHRRCDRRTAVVIFLIIYRNFTAYVKRMSQWQWDILWTCRNFDSLPIRFLKFFINGTISQKTCSSD
jgi:hypothetical protein